MRALRPSSALVVAALLAGTASATTSPGTVVVTAATENLYARPDETAPVDDQVILGDRLTVLEDATGFAKVRTAAGEVAWIPERALRRGDLAARRRREGRSRDVELRPRLLFPVLHHGASTAQCPGRGEDEFFGFLRR